MEHNLLVGPTCESFIFLTKYYYFGLLQLQKQTKKQIRSEIEYEKPVMTLIPLIEPITGLASWAHRRLRCANSNPLILFRIMFHGIIAK